jgi:N-acetylmuramoyl-L-alanine amidase
MISTLLFLLQVADTSTAITVRAGETTTTVPIVFTRAGRLVRADEIAHPLGARLTRLDRERFRLEAGGAALDFTLQLSAVRIGREVASLPTPPVERAGVLYAPLAAFTDVLPRYAIGYAFDRNRGEIRRLAPLASVIPKTSAGSVDLSRRAGKSRAAAPIIVVDAGHGGPDRGMRGPIGARRQVQEADITLAVARQLRQALLAHGAEVIMTRSTDTLIALRDRGRIANRAGADLFLSIHVNAANPRWPNPRSARGVETYFLSEAKTEDERRVAEMENDAQKYDVGIAAEPGDPFSFMMADMVQNEYLRESSELADLVQRGLSAVHPGGDRGVKQAGFAVLVTAHMPAVLVEIGFGTNASEAQFLSTSGEQQRIARAIAAATMKYFAEYQQRRTGTRARMQ